MKKGIRYEFGKEALSTKQIRAIEAELGVYIVYPKHPDEEVSGEEFDIYDEDENYVGVISSRRIFFLEEELRGAVKSLFV